MLILGWIVIPPDSSTVPLNPSVSAWRHGGVLIVREAEGDCSSYQNRHRQPDRGQNHCHPWLHPPAIKRVFPRYSTSVKLFTAFWFTLHSGILNLLILWYVWVHRIFFLSFLVKVLWHKIVIVYERRKANKHQSTVLHLQLWYSYLTIKAEVGTDILTWK